MKITNLSVFTSIIALTIGIIANTAYATNVSLLNTFKRPLMFTKISPDGTTKEYTLNDKAITYQELGGQLGDIDTISGLNFKTTCPPYIHNPECTKFDLSDILTKIKAEKNNHPNADVIINIHQASRIAGLTEGGLTIRLFWEAK
jgi:hypothetical protein